MEAGQPLEACMSETPESTRKDPQLSAIEHIAEARSILTRLRDRMEEHPELEQAIEELELALSKLTLRTGGML
jgi:predicted component of type VI protein secretion system